MKELESFAEIQHLKDARRERERAGKGDLEERLCTKTQDTWRWQMKVQELQDMKLFLDDNSPRPVSLESATIEAALSTIGTEIQSLRLECSLGTITHVPTIRRNSDLESLLYSMFRNGISIGEMRKLLASEMVKWGLPMIVKGLIVAAIKDWVFDTDFPNFSSQGDPRILEEYRSIISSFGECFEKRVAFR